MLRIRASALIALGALALPALAQPATQSATLSITDAGAVADGTTLNTSSIQKAIDQLADKGGGTLRIPPGTFRTGALFLKPGVDLFLEKGAVLKGSTDINDYPKQPTRIEGHTEPWIPALLNADHARPADQARPADHLRISGEGTLDGSGEPFWNEFLTRRRADMRLTNLAVERPRLLFIANAQNVEVTGIHLLNSGFWNFHLYNCKNVRIDGLDIKAGDIAPSSDGIDVDSCQDVDIRNCTIHVNDDGIALKGSKGPRALEDKNSPPVENIHIANVTFTRTHGVVTCGSEATIVRHVLVENCTVTNAPRGAFLVRLKLRPDTPQTYEDIVFRGITVNGDAALFGIAPWTQFFDLQGQPRPTRTIRNLTVSDIKGSLRNFGSMKGNADDTLENITLENLDLQLQDPKVTLGPIKNLTVKNVKINGATWTPPSQEPGTR